MTPRWDAERRITPDEARHFIRDQMLAVEAHEVELIGEGWDNLVFRVDERWVFRFPRRELGAQLLRNEAMIMPRVAHRLTMPVPVPIWYGEPCPEYPWPFVGYRYLHGQVASQVALSEDQRGRQAERLGRFLAELHALPTNGFRDLPDDDIGRMNLALRVPRTHQLLVRARELGLLGRGHGFAALLDSLPRRPRPGVLVHGDLWSNQILVDESQDVCAVLDWGDVHRGDPAADLMLAHTFLPVAARGRLREAYGGVDADTWKLARFRALNHTLNVTIQALDVGDQQLLDDGRAALARIAEDE